MITTKISDLLAEDALLVQEAQKATELSYAPYSNFHVGAAVLLENGEIIRGANQENASYPCSICAERATLATAQNIYPGIPIVAIALAAKDCSASKMFPITSTNGGFVDEPISPCGMCRQVIGETEKRYGKPIRIIMSSSCEAIIASGIKEILPLPF